MQYFVYVLRSAKNNNLYVGSTGDLKKRIALHNLGKVRSTKAYSPWQLVYDEMYNSRSEAVQRERFLKTGQQKELLKQKYGAVAKR